GQEGDAIRSGRGHAVSPRLSRRDLLKGVALLGGAGLKARTTTAFSIAGRPVQIVVSSVSPLTARISVLAIEDGRLQTIPSDGALDERIPPSPPASVTATPIDSAHAGDLVVDLSADPMTIRI